MPRPKLSCKQLARLKSTFRAADCTVRDLKGSNFEIFHAELPLRSHVLVNPYYLQLGTILTARPISRRDNSQPSAGSTSNTGSGLAKGKRHPGNRFECRNQTGDRCSLSISGIDLLLLTGVRDHRTP
jgi:hypothetical protein